MITQQELKEHLYYHSESGDFVRIRRGLRGIDWVGQQAGAADTRGYIIVNVKERSYQGHRLAWFYVHGRWPKPEIDHINRDKSDNRLCNLREVPRGENARNRAPRNKTGFMGVRERRGGRRYEANITIDRRQRYLGVFSTAEEAFAAYQKALPG